MAFWIQCKAKAKVKAQMHTKWGAYLILHQDNNIQKQKVRIDRQQISCQTGKHKSLDLLRVWRHLNLAL